MSLQKQSILFINGLDKTVNENMLYMLFNDYSVSYIKIAKDHQSHESFGYAFIGFKNCDKAEEALKKLNYSKLAKKTLNICWYNREPGNLRHQIENNIFVKKISKDISTKEFHEYFNKFGNIISAKLAEDEEGETMGYGFILYDSKEGAKNAIKECNGKEWNGKKLYVSQFIRNRPKQEPKFNNIYVKNIPKEWSEKDVKKYFSKYGEIDSMIVKVPEANVIKKELPEDKKRQILNHKYAFVCYKSLDGPAKIVVSKVPYLKIKDLKYNKKIEEIAKRLNISGVKEDNMYKCACYIIENNLEEKTKNKVDLDKAINAFNNVIKENDGQYFVRYKENRLYCCQALKKTERAKKLRLLYEKIKNKIKEKYKFCNLYIKNLPEDFTDENLKELFGKYGEIRSSKVVKREIDTYYLIPKRIIKVFGFVCYYEASKAREAKQNLNGKYLLENGLKLYVDYHQCKKERANFLKLKFIKNSYKLKNIQQLVPPMTLIQQYRQNIQRVIPYNTSELRQNIIDPNVRTDYFGERLFTKISDIPQFNNYSKYFAKIVGIFLDLDDNVLDKLLNDDRYFIEQVKETIKLLTEKESPN